MVRAFTLLALLFVGLAACDDSPTDPEVRLWWNPVPPPENLVRSIEVIYNDKVRTAAERIAAYENLFAPSFVYTCESAGDTCGCQDWGRDEEIQAHRKIFQAQDSVQIYSLTLDIKFSPAKDLDPPDPARPGWKQVFAGNISLVLPETPNDGYALNGAQAEFLMQPSNGRWFISEWRDLPRPGPSNPSSLVEPVTWCRIKRLYF